MASDPEFKHAPADRVSRMTGKTSTHAWRGCGRQRVRLAIALATCIDVTELAVCVEDTLCMPAN